MNQEELEQDLKELARTNRELIKQHSFWRSFWRGVITAVGATVGAAVVLALLAWMLNQLTGIQFLRPAAEKALDYLEDTSDRIPLPRDSALPEPTYSTEPSPTLSPSLETTSPSPIEQ